MKICIRANVISLQSNFSSVKKMGSILELQNCLTIKVDVWFLNFFVKIQKNINLISLE